MNLQETLDRYLLLVEAELDQVVRPLDPARPPSSASRTGSGQSLEPYYHMMRYHLGWMDAAGQATPGSGGKRLRPILCLLACEASGGDPMQAVPAAASVELVHNFSLVHDDIQDASPTRRGRRAVWDLWGSAHGINVGDGLFVLARLGAHRLTGLGVPPGRQLAVLRALDRACLSLCEGQFLDMSFGERLDVSLEQYLRMIRLKTGALLLAAAEIGAIVAGAEQPVIDHMAAFGENLGVAFQIQDDILGTWGEECVTGKSATTDVRDKKKTLPLTYALAQPEEKGISGPLRALLRQPGTLAANEIEAVIELLERSGAREYAELSAREHYALAISHLEQAGKSHPARSLLQELGASLLGRVS